MKKFLLILAVILAFGAALAGGYYWGLRSKPTADTAAAVQDGRKILYWYDPMTPAQHFNHPGKSPFMPSMDLVPKYAGQSDAAGSAPVLRIDPRIEQNLGMRTAVVRVAALAPELRVTGILDWDRNRAVVVSARTGGILTKVYVRAPYARVRAGQPLAVLLSPDWSAAAAELGALNDAHNSEMQSLHAAALARLRVLGMSAAEIRQLSADPTAGVILRAPANGVVSTLNALPGQSVTAGATLMRIDDPARLWLNVAIPQAEIAGIRAGTQAQIRIDALPGRIFSGTVAAMLPEVDARTRTQTARIVLDNPDNALAPGMYASVGLHPSPGKAYPLVPDNALISTGLDNRVVLDLGKGRLEPRAVRTGRSAGGYTEIRAGLQGGERVVTSGEFLFDSESDMNGALKRLTVPLPYPASDGQRKILYWYDPMAPARHFNHGGPSPLMPSMNLVPKYADTPSAPTVPPGPKP
ncbi:MAG TPA: efflux RND transporter periplasmic adaptor subunit [Burkholderiales bacterium]|nr:efflux RND transporter periplasmic adaptor subunit [Burkholderiales bacterium]